MENTKIQDWYMQEYPSDTMGKDIKSEVTFYDVFYALDHHHDVYETIGVGDSMIRERVFQKLCDIMGVEYDYIYSQWLLTA